MAVQKKVRKRREKKNIERGAVHIRSTFNNTIVTITHGQVRAASVSAAPERALRLHHRWLQRLRLRLLWSTDLSLLKCM